MGGLCYLQRRIKFGGEADAGLHVWDGDGDGVDVWVVYWCGWVVVVILSSFSLLFIWMYRLLSFSMHCEADQALSQGFIELDILRAFGLEKVLAFWGKGLVVRFKKGKGVLDVGA